MIQQPSSHISEYRFDILHKIPWGICLILFTESYSKEQYVTEWIFAWDFYCGFLDGVTVMEPGFVSLLGRDGFELSWEELDSIRILTEFKLKEKLNRI